MDNAQESERAPRLSHPATGRRHLVAPVAWCLLTEPLWRMAAADLFRGQVPPFSTTQEPQLPA
jgi:hypothetical protein